HRGKLAAVLFVLFLADPPFRERVSKVAYAARFEEVLGYGSDSLSKNLSPDDWPDSTLSLSNPLKPLIESLQLEKEVSNARLGFNRQWKCPPGLARQSYRR